MSIFSHINVLLAGKKFYLHDKKNSLSSLVTFSVEGLGGFFNLYSEMIKCNLLKGSIYYIRSIATYLFHKV